MCELRYYANATAPNNGDTSPHHVTRLVLSDAGTFDIFIDNIQTTLPILVSCPTPNYLIH
jgi:hypothetical protein